MPKKKPPRNAFYFFMVDFKARCERNGERFPNGLRDVQEVASPEWNAMPAERKKQYEDMAKEEKIRLKGDNSQKETCLHKSFSSVEKEKREKEEEKYQMNTFIESTISSLNSRKLLAEYKFYLIHVNYFCVSEGECYHAAELALCEFSLGQGVTNVYHTVIDPGTIPLGYRHDAMLKSDSTHKIPFENNGGERNFYKILTDLNKFIQPGTNALAGEYPPLYTMPHNVNLNNSEIAVKSVIENLCDADSNGRHSPDKYRIYPIEKLFFEITKACSGDDDSKTIPNVAYARLHLENDVFNYTQNIACEFHQKEDAVEYCSKSCVQRWAFLICDYCCKDLNITIIPGRHLPVNADVDFSRRKELAQTEEKKANLKEFTWSGPETKTVDYVAVERDPLPRPKVEANKAAMIPPEEFDPSSFPSLEDGFVLGRGRNMGGRGRGRRPGPTTSFASAMKNKNK